MKSASVNEIGIDDPSFASGAKQDFGSSLKHKVISPSTEVMLSKFTSYFLPSINSFSN